MPEEEVAHPLEAHHEDVQAIPENLNWLNAHEMRDRWKAVAFKINPADKRRRDVIIKERKRMIEAMLRGWLEMYNNDKNRNHKIVKCTVTKNDNVDTFFVKAIISPPQERDQHDHDENGDENGHGEVRAANGNATANAGGGRGGGHLVPHPPPPPDDCFGL